MPMSTLGTTKALRAHMILRHHPNLGEVPGGVCSLEDMQDPAEALKSHQYDADQCRANYEVAPSVAVACAAGSAHKKQLPSEAAYVPKLAAFQDATSAGGGDDDDDVGD